MILVISFMQKAPAAYLHRARARAVNACGRVAWRFARAARWWRHPAGEDALLRCRWAPYMALFAAPDERTICMQQRSWTGDDDHVIVFHQGAN